MQNAKMVWGEPGRFLTPFGKTAVMRQWCMAVHFQFESSFYNKRKFVVVFPSRFLLASERQQSFGSGAWLCIYNLKALFTIRGSLLLFSLQIPPSVGKTVVIEHCCIAEHLQLETLFLK